MTMQEVIDRVTAERDDLVDKVLALRTFLREPPDEVSHQHLNYLQIQESVMNSYAIVLNQRLNLFMQELEPETS